MKYFIETLLLTASFSLAHTASISVANEKCSEMQMKNAPNVEQILSKVQRSCLQKTGNDETFAKIGFYFMMARNCITDKVGGDLERLTSDVEELTESKWVQFFSTYCPKLNASLSCMDPVVVEIRKCFDQTELDFVDIMVGFVPEALNLLCKDHGKIIINNDGNFQKCFYNMREFAESCSGAVSKTREGMHLSSYGERQCNELVQVRNCFQSKVNECNAPRLIELVDIVFRPGVRASPCKKYIQLDGNAPAFDEYELVDDQFYSNVLVKSIGHH